MAFSVEILKDSKGLQDFLQLPHHIYQSDNEWVAPLHSEVQRTLDPVKNPYFNGVDLQKFVCYDGKVPIARAIAVINPAHWEKFGRKAAFFGFFEAENDTGAVTALFEAIGKYCRHQGATSLEGPFNPNHYSELGLLVQNFTQPVFFETYNPPYYQVLLKNIGFNSICRLHTRSNKDTRDFMKENPPGDKTRPQTHGYTVRPFNLLRLNSDLERIREVYNDAFSENWHFLPVSHREYMFSARGLFLVTNPKLIQIVEHKGEPVGVLQCVLNINPLLKPLNGKMRVADLPRLWRQRSQIQEIVIYAIGIKKAYQNGRAFQLLHAAMGEMVKRYPTVYTTWTTDENATAVRASEIIGLKPYKWFEIFEKPLIN
ncbi:MAG: hypothetical protein IPM82_29090 [Saprospiraceae bacterium]|nr:hypothetical protein [Saprospiraceae bacterium]